MNRKKCTQPVADASIAPRASTTAIPAPVAKGEPDAGFPYPWSVYRWLDGEPAATARVGDLTGFATTLAGFLSALGRCDATGGPEPGRHNFFRGGPLATYEREALEAIDALGDEVPRDDVLRAWEAAMSTTWDRDPVWFHGDVAVGNLLVRDGRLAAVIDFGTSGVGDPACDMVIAWTFLSGPSRDRFRAELGVDPGTWSRGRGWALWKALITLVGHLERGAPGGGPGPPRHRARSSPTASRYQESITVAPSRNGLFTVSRRRGQWPRSRTQPRATARPRPERDSRQSHRARLKRR